MAFHKFPKTKTFHVDYCGCTAASLLLNEQAIREGINFIRKVKTKREFIKTNVSLSKLGIKIIYGNDDNTYATHVPSSMIGGATSGKSSLNDTVGVVYISPLTSNHYPAFVHVYRCESARTARKLLTHLRAYNYNESHRSKILQLEQNLIGQNLLNVDYYDSLQVKSESSKTATLNSIKTNTHLSSSSTNSSNQLDKIDPVKSITQEFQKKLDSHEPLLYPPKDYDTVRAAHGNIQRAQAWKSTEPTIVGYTSIDPDNNQVQKVIIPNFKPQNGHSTKNEFKKRESNNNGIDKSAKQRYSTQKSDTTIDPVEAVSLAFEFLKDETGSIVTDNDDNIEYHEPEQENEKQPVFRFLPPPINAITKKIFTRTNNYELTNAALKQNLSMKSDLNTYYQNAHYQHQRMPYEHRTRSETNLLYNPQPRMHLSPRYESRLVNGSGAPISTNPLWTATSPVMVGSQPNLLSHQSPIALPSYYHHYRRPSSPMLEQKLTSAPLQHPLYAGYPNNNTVIMARLQENHHKRPPPPPPPVQGSHLNRKETTASSASQCFDTNEFILRAFDGNERSSSNPLYLNRSSPKISRDFRPHSVSVTGHEGTKLDVYY